jgi:hypothetical protein
VRAADTNKLEAAPEAAGLDAVMTGISIVAKNDHEAIEKASVAYDALYVNCKLKLLREKHKTEIEKMDRRQQREFLQITHARAIAFTLPKAQIKPEEGKQTTYDVLLRKYSINDPIAIRIGEFVHDFEINAVEDPKRVNFPETLGLCYILKGLENTSRTDHETIEKSTNSIRCVVHIVARRTTQGIAQKRAYKTSPLLYDSVSSSSNTVYLCVQQLLFTHLQQKEVIINSSTGELITPKQKLGWSST